MSKGVTSYVFRILTAAVPAGSIRDARAAEIIGARSCGEKRNTRTHGSRNARNARRAQKRTQGEQIPTERRNGAEISGEETREAAPLIPGI